MRKLTEIEIISLASRKGVKKIAVENFLCSMGVAPGVAKDNLRLDAALYKWDNKTQKAIRDGILLAQKVKNTIIEEFFA